MVSFQKLLVASSAFAAPIAAHLTPGQVVTNIKLLTQKSQSIQAPAQSITIINGPLIVIGQGPFPEIIRGFTDIVSTATTVIVQMQGMPPVTQKAESDAIFDAFREFVRVHQVLLNILIGKAGLFNTIPLLGAPVALVLRQIEKVVDTIAIGLIGAVQSRASDLQSQAQSLTGSLDVAIKSYSGITAKRTKRSLRFTRREIAAVA